MLRIKEILKEKGLTQIELATKLGTTKQQINNIVSERVGVSLPMLQNIANALDVPIWHLLTNPKTIHREEPKECVCALIKIGTDVQYFDDLDSLKDYVEGL